MQIPLELVLQIAVNLVTLMAIYVRMETKMAVIQVEMTHIKNAMRLPGRVPSEG